MRPALQNVEDGKFSGASAARPSRDVEPPDLPANWTWNWEWIALACYFTGFGVMFIRLVAGTIQAHTMIRQAAFVDGVLTSAQCAAPVTIGWLRPIVVLPTDGPENRRNWPETKLDAVLTHEREHVRRRDPLVQWLALLNRCVFCN